MEDGGGGLWGLGGVTNPRLGLMTPTAVLYPVTIWILGTADYPGYNMAIGPLPRYSLGIRTTGKPTLRHN